MKFVRPFRPDCPRRRWRSSLLLLVAALLIGAAGPTAQEEPDERVMQRNWGDRISIFGGEIHIPSDVVQGGMVVVVGDKAIIEGEVTQDVVVILGSLEIRGGQVRGSVIGVLSDLDLEHARVRDVLINVLGSLSRLDSFAGQTLNFGLGNWFPDVWQFLFWSRMVKLVLLFVLLLLLTALAPERIRLISEEAPVRYFPAFFVGLLGYLALMVVLVLLLATVIGFFAAILLFKVVKWLCIAGIFAAVGQRLGRTAGRELSLLGAVLLPFGAYAVVVAMLSMTGLPGLMMWVTEELFFALMIEVPAVGLMILTRAGTRRGNGQPEAPPATAATPPPPPASPPAEPQSAAAPQLDPPLAQGPVEPALPPPPDPPGKPPGPGD